MVAVTAWPAMGAEEKKAPAGKPAIQKLKIAGEPSDKKPGDNEETDLSAVPDGTPAELVEYIKRVATADSPRNMDELKKRRALILDAAEKILAAKPNQQELELAVDAKMNMLEKPEQFVAFIDELKKGGHEKLARRVRGFKLQVELRQRVMARDKKVKDVVEQIVSFLEETPPEVSDISLAHMTDMVAEMSGDTPWAVKTCGRLAKIFADSKDPKLADFTKVLEGVVRRLDLVGQEIKIEGKLLDGKSLDWSKYAGKVVLVFFWSTEHPACMGELPSLKAAYDAYHAKGFEIVGISLDRNRADLEDCLKARSITWPNVVSDGKPNPAMIYYGITNLPTMILVGKDGKVSAIGLNGIKLKKALEDVFGPADAKPESGKDK
jgi:peroxiredoxin